MAGARGDGGRAGRAVLAIAMVLAACDGPAIVRDAAVEPDAGPSRDAAPRLDAPPARDAGPPLPGPYPAVDALGETPLPDLFVGYDGTRRVVTTDDWATWRRAELRDLLSFYVFGYTPERAVPVTVTTLATIDDFVPGQVRYDELELALGSLGIAIHVSLFTPVGASAPPPVFVAPNRCGNQETTADPRVRATTAWMDPGTCGATIDASRGVRASQWPIETIVAAGYAFAAFHESELDPDDTEDDFANGIHPLLLDPARDARLRWGRIAAWAWGVSRVVDGLETSPLVDPRRIAVVGHSRRGKTALLAGALDERIAMVIAHQSGTGGAALTRHLSGESVEAVNTFFPSWFDDVFPTFAGHEARIPADQHMLIALVAPRLLLVTDGDDDAWADPAGARMAVDAASPVWPFLGGTGLVLDGAGAPTLDGALAYATRPGGHELTALDWSTFLAFADRHWP